LVPVASTEASATESAGFEEIQHMAVERTVALFWANDVLRVSTKEVAGEVLALIDFG
jgi:hypothetical protein